MISIGHSAVGVIIGEVIILSVGPNKSMALWLLLAFCVALVMHYAMDFLPHGHYYVDYKRLDSLAITKASLDFLGGVFVFLILAGLKYGTLSMPFWIIVIAIAGSQLADIFEVAIKFKLVPQWKLARAHSNFHKKIHWHNEPDGPLPSGARPFKWTDVWQVGVIITAVIILL